MQTSVRVVKRCSHTRETLDIMIWAASLSPSILLAASSEELHPAARYFMNGKEEELRQISPVKKVVK